MSIDQYEVTTLGNKAAEYAARALNIEPAAVIKEITEQPAALRPLRGRKITAFYVERWLKSRGLSVDILAVTIRGGAW